LPGALRSCKQAVAILRRLAAAEPRLELRRVLGVSLYKLDHLQERLMTAAAPEGTTPGSIHSISAGRARAKLSPRHGETLDGEYQELTSGSRHRTPDPLGLRAAVR
jgi:hypothetical protein